MILYRGTSEEEDEPVSHEYDAIFMTDSADAASNYGPYVQVYEVGKPRLLNLDNKANLKVVRDYRDVQPSATGRWGRPREVLPWHYEIQELAIHPEPGWIEYLAHLGYDGYRYEGYNIVALFDSDKNRRRFKLIDRLIRENI